VTAHEVECISFAQIRRLVVFHFELRAHVHSTH